MSTDLLQWRNIKTPCPICRGAGGYWYGSTSTWRGGIGGAAMTWGVCDTCWGSGDEHHHWMDLRKLQATEDARVLLQAARVFTDAVGSGWEALHPAVLYIREHILTILKQRRVRPEYTDTVVYSLAKLLKAMVDGKESDEDL